MERIKHINPHRFEWCCSDRGVTLDQCAKETGIAPRTLERAMDGESVLSFAQLSKLAAYFGRGVLFFLESEPVDDEVVHTPQFRTLANQKPELTPRLKAFIERVENARAIYLDLLAEMDRDDFARFIPPDVDGKSPQEAGHIAREWLRLGDTNDFVSYRQAAEANGILVVRSNGYAGQWQIAKESPILGFSLYFPEFPVIVVKKQVAEARQVFTLMHELGHLLLHRTSHIDDINDFGAQDGVERDANAFAGALLVPDYFLAQIADGDRPQGVEQLDDWLRPYCRVWGVSTEVILRRLTDGGRLPRRIYNDYRGWRDQQQAPEPDDGGSRVWRHREPIHIFGDPFVRTVLTALSAKRITLAKASRFLDNLTVARIHELERFYAGV